MTSADTYLNSDWTWNGTMNQANKTADVRTVTTRELGHWLRLLHPNQRSGTCTVDGRNAVMTPSYVVTWSLDTDDRAASAAVCSGGRGMGIRPTGTVLGMAGALAAAAVVSLGANDGGKAAPPRARQVPTMDGFPLDRTLTGLVTFPDVDLVVPVDGVSLGSSRWTTPDGAEPAYVTQGRAPTMEEGGHGHQVVTDFRASVDRTLLDRAGDEVAGQVTGGSVGAVDFVASDEIAPPPSAMTGRLLLAGKVTDGVLHPSFVYRVDAAGNAESPLASASTAPASFTARV